MSETVATAVNKDWSALRTLHRDQIASLPTLLQTERPTNTTGQQSKLPLSGIDIDRLSSFLSQYPQAWRAIRELLGPEEALRLAQLRRNDAMTTLRVKHRWSLQAIGDLFDLSRERVRQLTPSIDGNGVTPDLGDGTPSDSTTIKAELEAVFRKAVRTPHAWNGRGQVSKSWVIKQLGYEPELPELDFRSLADSKTEFILRHGMGLRTKQDMRAWLEVMYFEQHMTYAEIAHWLSQRFVSLAPMTVHRFATGILDIEGYGRGKRMDR